MEDAPPRKIGRYEVQRELGRGTMGVVYQGHDPALGRPIALKTVSLAFSVSPEEREAFEQRFFAEARIAARLSHPGIVVVHDVGRDPETGVLYMALEYLRGQSLAQITSQGHPLEWREALRIVARVAEALHHAHAKGVVHRDIKPANIMVLDSGEPKIMDFGIAKIETARLKLTKGGDFFGTPLYMAPEQALGQPVDGRADLFSLGTIAYALLTGRQAFAAENIPRILGRVVHDDPTPPSHAVPGLPRAVDYVVARAMAKSPSGRYPDGGTMAEDFEDVLAGRPLRHRAGWTARGAETISERPGELEELPLEPVVSEDGVEAELEAVVGAGPASLPPLPRPASPPPTSKLLPRRRTMRRSAVAVTAALAALVAGYLALGPDGASGPAPAERPSPRAPGAPRPTPEPPRSVKEPPAPAREGSTEPARLLIDFQHPLKSGTLRVWVDDSLVLEEALESQVTKKVIVIEVRKGSVKEALEVTPGSHEVRVQVSWDKNVKAERIQGSFQAGGTRRLEVRVSRLRKRLSLEWK